MMLEDICFVHIYELSQIYCAKYFVACCTFSHFFKGHLEEILQCLENSLHVPTAHFPKGSSQVVQYPLATQAGEANSCSFCDMQQSTLE